jgi:hypothetical protein
MDELERNTNMTNTEAFNFARMHGALKAITKYQTPDQLRKSSRKDWGVELEEALEMAYENIQETAKDGISGVRLPKRDVRK